jgi:hypothetical protein
MQQCLFAWADGCVLDSEVTAAWIQAIGSIVAIIVSAAFALWVPLHVRALSERDAVTRAITAARASALQNAQLWRTFPDMLHNNRFGEGSPYLILAAVQNARRNLEAVNAAFFVHSALPALTGVDISLDLLAHSVRSAELARAEGKVWTPQTSFFAEAQKMADEALGEIKEIEVLRIGSHWIGVDLKGKALMAEMRAKLPWWRRYQFRLKEP